MKVNKLVTTTQARRGGTARRIDNHYTAIVLQNDAENPQMSITVDTYHRSIKDTRENYLINILANYRERGQELIFTGTPEELIELLLKDEDNRRKTLNTHYTPKPQP